MPTIAMSESFLDGFAAPPKAQQRKVREFTQKFRRDPTVASINYEKIHCARDPRVRTVRIGSDYRAVVLHPDSGETFVLVWVDHHDEAIEWTRHRLFDVNPQTGAIQVIDISEAERALSTAARLEPTLGLFDAHADEILIGLGIPAVLLPAVRALRTQPQLEAIQKHLPSEAAEALMWLAEGIPVDEVYDAVARPATVSRGVDVADYDTALHHPDSRRRFVVIESDRDLNAILDCPLAKWRIFLHPSQGRLVSRHYNGPACVFGCAGTGKTVAAMHRTKRLLQEVFNSPSDRVLFTTFTANLARDIRLNLQNLCGEEIARVDVMHLDSWAASYLAAHGVAFELATDEERRHCWEEAVASTGIGEFTLAFLRQEWEEVIQAREIETLEQYLGVPRTGRGATLSRAQRSRVWEVCTAFRACLNSAERWERSDILGKTRQFVEADPAGVPYSAIVVDEVQDLSIAKLRLLRAMVSQKPNDLFLVGDASQRIYGAKVRLSAAGIHVRGRSNKLRVNYRTTEEIRSWAVHLLRGVPIEDLDGAADSLSGYRSLMSGPAPEVHSFSGLAEEQAHLAAAIEEMLRERAAEEICLVARTVHALRQHYWPALERRGIPCVTIDKSADLARDKVRLATMHRVKGLEFPCMIIAGVNEGVVPQPLDDIEVDPQVRAEHDVRERCLLFVAATRARDRLVVTTYGQPSRYLR